MFLRKSIFHTIYVTFTLSPKNLIFIHNNEAWFQKGHRCLKANDDVFVITGGELTPKDIFRKVGIFI